MAKKIAILEVENCTKQETWSLSLPFLETLSCLPYIADGVPQAQWNEARSDHLRGTFANFSHKRFHELVDHLCLSLLVKPPKQTNDSHQVVPWCLKSFILDKGICSGPVVSCSCVCLCVWVAKGVPSYLILSAALRWETFPISPARLEGCLTWSVFFRISAGDFELDEHQVFLFRHMFATHCN